MAFDGIFVHKMNSELAATLSGARVDKIHQPVLDELVLFLRSKQGNFRLIINLSANPRIYLSSSSPENPATPFMFCMLLRKHLLGAKLCSVESEGFERITKLCFESFNEMGDPVKLCLAIELISSCANAILINTEGKIIDSLRRSDIESSARLIQPGATYTLPERRQKLSATEDLAKIVEAVSSSDLELWQGILDTVDGIGPLAAREIASAVFEDTSARPSLIPDLSSRLTAALKAFRDLILSAPTPTLVIKDNKPFDFYFYAAKSYSGQISHKSFSSLSELCDEFFTERDALEQMASKSAELKKQLSTLRSRLIRKAAARRADLEKCADAEELRIKGELIKANIHCIRKGDAFCTLTNYYSENCDDITVSLDPALSAADNATRYFKEYKKRMSAKGMLGELIASCDAELDYIESVCEALSRAKTTAELEQIKLELADQGYIKRKILKKEKRPTPTPLKFVSESGFEILIGRNNLENDRITCTLSEKCDIWFHTKDIHGSHVVVKTGGKTPDNATLTLAAEIAAFNSKARNSSLVPVDYTLIKYVKKPSGAKPGAVIYTNQQTAYVNPTEHIK